MLAILSHKILYKFFINTISTIFVVRIVLNMDISKAIRPTSLDYAIIGLVHSQPLSGYGIRKKFELTALGNYGSSPGAIYPALKRLEKLGLVENIIFKEDGKNKFQCTGLGVSALREWVTKPLEQKDVAHKAEELFLKFSFMDTLVEKEQINVFLKSFRDLSKAYLEELQEYHKNEYSNLSLHGRLALEYGIESFKITFKWCKSTILSITKN